MEALGGRSAAPCPPLTNPRKPLETEPSRPSKRTRGGPSIGPNQVPRDGPFIAHAGLHFFQGMGQGADRPRQHEQSAAERRRETEFGEKDRKSTRLNSSH